MKHQVTATVGARPAEVWRLFADVERWPEMTPSIRQVRRMDTGPLRAGSEAIVKQPGLPVRAGG
jgi:ribosome-associated toxin RatA of RatAB toxin-antitoxin module